MLILVYFVKEKIFDYFLCVNFAIINILNFLKKNLLFLSLVLAYIFLSFYFLIYQFESDVEFIKFDHSDRERDRDRVEKVCAVILQNVRKKLLRITKIP